MTKYFVTGGAGFIGSHLVDKLIQTGHTVTVYDNLSSGQERWIAHHFQSDEFRFVRDDLLNAPALADAMRGHDVIWHLGANTDIVAGNSDTDLDLNNGTLATYNILESARQNEIRKIIFASSACVYGDVPLVPLNETFGPLLPINLYGASKLACEGLLTAYSHLYGIKVWIFRFGNVVGDRMGHGVILDFIKKLQRDQSELEILGDGNQEKNFFLVEDCIDGMLCGFQRSNKPYDLFNLGCDLTVKVIEIARIVVEEMGLQQVKFKFTGGKRGWPGDAPHIMFDTRKISAMGWQPKYSSVDAVRIATRRLLGKPS